MKKIFVFAHTMF